VGIATKATNNNSMSPSRSMHKKKGKKKNKGKK
jgi:hypothetical protein